MTAPAGSGLRRAPVALLVGSLLAAGCGSATAQPDATTRTAGSHSTGVGTTAAAGRGPSGIAGQTVAITCGGASSGQACPRHPVRATINVLRMPAEQRVATIRTDSEGRFRLDVPPGTYELRARTSSVLMWARVDTTRVVPHRIMHTSVTFVPRHPLAAAPGAGEAPGAHPHS